MPDHALLLPSGKLDLGARRFDRIDGVGSSLTTRETTFLAYMAERIDHDVSRDALLVDVWGMSRTSLSRSVDSTVKRLRKKIELDGRRPESLLTVFGDGYRLRSRPSKVAAPKHMPGVSTILKLGAVRIDLSAGRIHRGDSTVTLSTQQQGLLRLLLRAHDGPVATQKIGRQLGMAANCERAVRTAIYRLRQVIEDDPRHPTYVIHVPGRGYLIETASHVPGPLSDARQALWQLTAHAGRSLGLPDCVLYVRQGNDLVQTAAWGPKTAPPMRIHTPIVLRLGQGIVGFAAAQGASQNVPDVRSDPRYVADLVPARSELAVPIVHNGSVVGVIDVESPQTAAFGPREQVALHAIGALAGPLASSLGEGLRRAG